MRCFNTLIYIGVKVKIYPRNVCKKKKHKNCFLIQWLELVKNNESNVIYTSFVFV